MRTTSRIALTASALIALIGLAMLLPSNAEAGRYSDDDRLWLGVMTETVDYDLIEEEDLDVKYGVYVHKVIDDTPAEEAGLQQGDIIISLDGMKITDNSELTDALTQFDEGQRVDLIVMRDGEEQTINVELEEADDDHFFSSTFGPAHTITIDADYGYLGVQLDDLNAQLGEFFGVEDGRGALIKEVIEESPAEKAGLKAGDVIVKVDKYTVRDVDDVVDEIREFEPGDKLSLTVIRDQEEKTIEVELGEREFRRSLFGDAGRHGLHGLHGLHALRGLGGLKGLEALEALEALEGLEIEIDVPDVPDAPVPPGAYIYPHYRHSADFDRDELEREMEEVRRQMKELRKELKELRDQLD